jgi:hypothetical protein
MRSRCCPCVCVCLCIPPIVARQRLVKSPLIVPRQRLCKSSHIVTRQRLRYLYGPLVSKESVPLVLLRTSCYSYIHPSNCVYY